MNGPDVAAIHNEKLRLRLQNSNYDLYVWGKIRTSLFPASSCFALPFFGADKNQNVILGKIWSNLEL